MKRMLWLGGVGIAVGLTGQPLVAQTTPEVIATNAPAAVAKPVAAIGQPQPIAAVGYQSEPIVRGQVPDKGPMPPAAGPGGFAPLHAPMPMPMTAPMPGGSPMVGGPLPPPVAVHPSMPCENCAPTPFDPGMAPLPGGMFAGPRGVQGGRFYLTADYLYWYIRDGGLPPLVSTGTPANGGILGAPGGTVIFGNDPLDTQGRSGVRYNMGWWFGDCQQWAVETGGFFLGQRSTNFSANSAQFPVLSRPFFNVNAGREDVDIISLPGQATGSVAVSSTNNFYGADVGVRRKLFCGDCSGWRIDATAGFRYLNFDEDLVITERSTDTNPLNNGVTPQTDINGNVIPGQFRPNTFGTTTVITDRFKVDNDFYGGYLGLISNWNRGRWNVELNTRVAVGTTRQRYEAIGSQTIFPGGGTGSVTTPSGLLARNGNLGVFTDDKFSVVPEVGFNFGYRFNPHWKFQVGYSFLYWSNIMRAGDQIDRNVNVAGLISYPQPGQVDPLNPNGPRIATGRVAPIAPLRDTDFWAQGINAGFQFTW